jgi:hypothetical protein
MGVVQAELIIQPDEGRSTQSPASKDFFGTPFPTGELL